MKQDNLGLNGKNLLLYPNPKTREELDTLMNGAFDLMRIQLNSLVSELKLEDREELILFYANGITAHSNDFMIKAIPDSYLSIILSSVRATIDSYPKTIGQKAAIALVDEMMKRDEKEERDNCIEENRSFRYEVTMAKEEIEELDAEIYDLKDEIDSYKSCQNLLEEKNRQLHLEVFKLKDEKGRVNCAVAIYNLEKQIREQISELCFEKKCSYNLKLQLYKSEEIIKSITKDNLELRFSIERNENMSDEAQVSNLEIKKLNSENLSLKEKLRTTIRELDVLKYYVDVEDVLKLKKLVPRFEYDESRSSHTDAEEAIRELVHRVDDIEENQSELDEDASSDDHNTLLGLIQKVDTFESELEEVRDQTTSKEISGDLENRVGEIELIIKKLNDVFL